MALTNTIDQEQKDTDIEIVTSLEDCVLKEDGLVVEIFGMPKSGKTWHIKRVINTLKNDPEFMELRPNFTYRCYKDDIKNRRSKKNRYSFHRCKVLDHEENLREVKNLDRKHSGIHLYELDLVLADRASIDDNHFAYGLYEEREIDLGQREKVLEISQEAEGLIDAGVLFYVTPEEALRREHETIKEIAEYERRWGKVMNPDTLERLSRIYDLTRKREAYKTVNKRGEPTEVDITTRHVKSIDTTMPDSKEVNQGELYKFFFELFVPTSDEYRLNGNG